MRHDPSLSTAMRVLAAAELSQVSGGGFRLLSLFGGCGSSSYEPKTSCHEREEHSCTPPAPVPAPVP